MWQLQVKSTSILLDHTKCVGRLIWLISFTQKAPIVCIQSFCINLGQSLLLLNPMYPIFGVFLRKTKTPFIKFPLVYSKSEFSFGKNNIQCLNATLIINQHIQTPTPHIRVCIYLFWNKGKYLCCEHGLPWCGGEMLKWREESRQKERKRKSN